MRRRATSVPQPAMPAIEKPKSMTAGGMKAFRVTGAGEPQMINAATVEKTDGGLTFKDASGNLVGIVSGYGISAVVDENATKCCADPCDTVKAMDLI